MKKIKKSIIKKDIFDKFKWGQNNQNDDIEKQFDNEPYNSFDREFSGEFNDHKISEIENSIENTDGNIKNVLEFVNSLITNFQTKICF